MDVRVYQSEYGLNAYHVKKTQMGLGYDVRYDLAESLNGAGSVVDEVRSFAVREADRTQTLLAESINELDAAVAILAEEGAEISFAGASRGFLDGLGLSRSATIGRSIHDVFLTEVSLSLQGAVRRASLQGGPSTFEANLRTGRLANARFRCTTRRAPGLDRTLILEIRRVADQHARADRGRADLFDQLRLINGGVLYIYDLDKPHALDLSGLLARLAARDEPPRPLKWIRASLGASMRVIAVDDVVYFQAEDKYTKVATADGEALIRKSIKELYEELDHDAFWQIHRGTIVNLQAIGRVDRDWRDQPVIVLKARDEKLTVSRTFAHRFKAM